MEIIASTFDDIPAIFKLYDEAIAFQKKVSDRHWKGFERSLVEKEINEKRQWKIMEGDQVACIFAIAFNDPLIWREKDKDKAIYLHRIVTNPLFRKKYYVKAIKEWTIDFAKKNGIDFVRMDTWGDNQKLLEYYTNCGFNFLGFTKITDTTGLPAHYEGLSLSLFEIKA